jgi:TonB family protein
MQSSRIRICLLLAGLAFSPLASAQTVFLAVEDKGPPKMVKRVSLRQPLVEIDGKTKVSSAVDFSFGHALFYRPGRITLSNFRVQNRHLVGAQTGGSFNHEFLLFGHATSDVELKDCFLVLEIDAWKTSACLFTELRDLGPGKSVDLTQTFKLNSPLGEGRYRLHIYSAGIEVLHTRMSPSYIAAQEEKTQALMAGKKQDFPPIAAHILPPDYPAELKSQKLAGSAEVKCLVTAKGVVKSVELVSATHPAFGPAAVAAVSKWKFDPAVKNRQFVDAETVVTVEFTAPK